MNAPFKLMALWLIGFLFFTVLDLLWIGVVAAPVYRAEVGSLLVLGEGMSAIRIVAAVITWLLITLSLVSFATPHLSPSVAVALARGALMGLVIYGVYDLTNFAVLRGWTLKVTVLDIVWGTVVCASTGVVIYWASQWIDSAPQGTQ